MNKLVKYIIESRFNFNIDQLDIENNEGDFSLSKQQYKSKSMKQEYIEHLFVDLGFPSGTLWCKYNLGVDPTKLDSVKDWYGNYYAWEETKPKSYYDWDAYEYDNFSYEDIGFNLTKYCTDTKYGNQKKFIDDLIELLPEDDAAYQINHSWKTPLEEDFNEFLEHTTNCWINDYNGIPGLNGRLFTSKINGKEIFIPVAGYWYQSEIDAAEYGGIWSSNIDIDAPKFGRCLSFYPDVFSGKPKMSNANRCYGRNIRAIMKCS